ncbi:hypothetical protein EJ02DRAFT_429533 [Clathrospora elynae]|uniref:Transcription factor domain-containing protein n=1 Tax=Clathrospora elynae TaxID=706981 RepID=A0A6A5T6E2_9PLEO|nr:hypothetical protein EJ02DRAFT_429533 [Clathrospora elynae]
MFAQQLKGHDASGGTGGTGGRLPPPEKEEQRPMAFMFIDSSNGGINAKRDKKVRSFVMKTARRKKPWNTRPKCSNTETNANDRGRRRSSSSRINNSNGLSKTLGHSPELECNTSILPSGQQMEMPPSSLAVSESPNSPCTEFRCAEDAFDFSNLEIPASTRRTSFNIGFARPLDCLAIRLDAGAERLLHQFVEATTPRLLPIDTHRSSTVAATDWVTTCIQSSIGAPFIYAALTSSARAAKLDPEAYKWRAISEVNRLLADPSKNTYDTTIATVLILLALEEADLADPMRKGTERGRSMSVFILMHSIAQSTTSFKRPYALLLDANCQIEDYLTISYLSPDFVTHILRQFHALGVDHALFQITSTVAVFIADLTTWYNTGTFPVDSLDLQKHASLLMYRLFDWYQQSSDAINASNAVIDQSICLALLIFMVIATEPNAQSFGSRLSKATAELYTARDKMPMHRWSNAPGLLFWILTMGALGAKNLPRNTRILNTQPTLPYFAQYSREVVAASGLHGMVSDEQLLERTRSYLWISTIFNDRVKRLWVSMGLCRADVVDVDDMSGSEGERDQVDVEYALGQSTTMRFFAADGKK